MNAEQELSRHELMALREIALTGRTNDNGLLLRLFADGNVADNNGDLQLTGKGRSLLLRGSPSLWTLAA